MAKKMTRSRLWTKKELRMLKSPAREQTKTTVIARKLKGSLQATFRSRQRSEPCSIQGSWSLVGRLLNDDYNLWRFLISFRSSRAIMSVTLISLEYGPRHSCLSP
jgi:hypothetical protein